VSAKKADASAWLSEQHDERAGVMQRVARIRLRQLKLVYNHAGGS